jgi:hypothetical protein
VGGAVALKPPLKTGREGHGNRVVFEKTNLGFRQNRSISFFHDFYNILHFDEFCSKFCLEFFNSILTKYLEIDSSFFIFYFKIFKFIKISNLTCRFLVNWSPPGFPVFMKTSWFLTNTSIHGCTPPVLRPIGRT